MKIDIPTNWPVILFGASGTILILLGLAAFSKIRLFLILGDVVLAASILFCLALIVIALVKVFGDEPPGQ